MKYNFLFLVSLSILLVPSLVIGKTLDSNPYIDCYKIIGGELGEREKETTSEGDYYNLPSNNKTPYFYSVSHEGYFYSLPPETATDVDKKVIESKDGSTQTVFEYTQDGEEVHIQFDYKQTSNGRQPQRVQIKDDYRGREIDLQFEMRNGKCYVTKFNKKTDLKKLKQNNENLTGSFMKFDLDKCIDWKSKRSRGADNYRLYHNYTSQERIQFANEIMSLLSPKATRKDIMDVANNTMRMDELIWKIDLAYCTIGGKILNSHHDLIIASLPDGHILKRSERTKKGTDSSVVGERSGAQQTGSHRKHTTRQ